MIDPYGKVTVLEPNGTTVRTASLYGNPFTWEGRRLDSETGLMQFRFRYYDTGLGRFIGRDPIGFVDGLSLYRAYFAPNTIDPLGLGDLETVVSTSFNKNTLKIVIDTHGKWGEWDEPQTGGGYQEWRGRWQEWDDEKCACMWHDWWYQVNQENSGRNRSANVTEVTITFRTNPNQDLIGQILSAAGLFNKGASALGAVWALFGSNKMNV